MRTWCVAKVEGTAEGLILCGDMEGAARFSRAICLNLALDGQLRVESCGTDVVGVKLSPSGTDGVLSHQRVWLPLWFFSR